MKVLNPDYKDFDIEPSDIYLRNKVGISIEIAELDKLEDFVAALLENRERYREKITKIIDEFIYYPKRSGQAGGSYIISQLNGENLF
jgi:YidC/Oxa1 family membrane protein insertase